jgi:hypothetical protein
MDFTGEPWANVIQIAHGVYYMVSHTCLGNMKHPLQEGASWTLVRHDLEVLAELARAQGRGTEGDMPECLQTMQQDINKFMSHLALAV